MSRSSYKGIYTCNKAVQYCYKRRIDTTPIAKMPLYRSSTIVNAFKILVAGIEKGRGVISCALKKSSATLKAGQFIFTRKPYFFPKKKRKIK